MKSGGQHARGSRQCRGSNNALWFVLIPVFCVPPVLSMVGREAHTAPGDRNHVSFMRALAYIRFNNEHPTPAVSLPTHVLRSTTV